jgi:hypothetical protein
MEKGKLASSHLRETLALFLDDASIQVAIAEAVDAIVSKGAKNANKVRDRVTVQQVISQLSKLTGDRMNTVLDETKGNLQNKGIDCLDDLWF